jgi:hypothetical protein
MTHYYVGPALLYDTNYKKIVIKLVILLIFFIRIVFSAVFLSSHWLGGNYDILWHFVANAHVKEIRKPDIVGLQYVNKQRN